MSSAALSRALSAAPPPGRFTSGAAGRAGARQSLPPTEPVHPHGARPGPRLLWSVQTGSRWAPPRLGCGAVGLWAEVWCVSHIPAVAEPVAGTRAWVSLASWDWSENR